MNNYIKNSLRLGIIVAAGAAAMVSCTDTWDDHYESPAMTTFDGTTMQAIEADAPEFAKIIKAVGYDRELNSDNVYTIWAPVKSDSTKATLDKWLRLAQSGTKKDSTEVVDKFIKNHIARYTVSDDGLDHSINLMSAKVTTMNAKGFGNVPFSYINNKKQTNISCNNGVLHLITNALPYRNNLFELLKQNYEESNYAAKDSVGGSLYTFLKAWDADSLDQNKSVSRGVDENGNKIWVDSVVIRNNTALKNVDALLYEEDSSYIAIIPSPLAYHKRFKAYKSLLKFNPSEDTKKVGACDSLANYYANMFTMHDLYFNNNANEHSEDSLKSTVYTALTSPYSVYYMKDKVDQPADRPTHNILEGLTPTACSNGTGYQVEDFPMSMAEQAYKKINLQASSVYLSSASDASGKGLYTKNVSTTGVTMKSGTYTDYYDPEDSTKHRSASYRFLDVPPSSSSTNPYISFWIPNTLSGTYDIYLVTSPIWAKNGFNNGQKYEDDPRAYRFYSFVWERNEKGEYPSSASKQLLNPNEEDSVNYGTKIFVTNPVNKVDTLYLGEYTFANTYYGRGETENLAGVMLQLQVYITSKLTSSYSREMLISKVVLKPKAELLEEDSKRRK